MKFKDGDVVRWWRNKEMRWDNYAMTRDVKDDDWIRRDAMTNDRTRRSMDGFTRVHERRNQQICHVGLFRRKWEQFYDATRWFACCTNPVDEWNQIWNTGYTRSAERRISGKTGRKGIVELRLILRGFSWWITKCVMAAEPSDDFPVDAPECCWLHTQMKWITSTGGFVKQKGDSI